MPKFKVRIEWQTVISGTTIVEAADADAAIAKVNDDMGDYWTNLNDEEMGDITEEPTAVSAEKVED